jgi:superfamily II helicase
VRLGLGVVCFFSVVIMLTLTMGLSIVTTTTGVITMITMLGVRIFHTKNYVYVNASVCKSFHAEMRHKILTEQWV